MLIGRNTLIFILGEAVVILLYGLFMAYGTGVSGPRTKARDEPEINQRIQDVYAMF